jgi:2-polyprenyl-3-methyl-5-hydroxy-6-metoxy-1,4-benzoquinol methylase
MDSYYSQLATRYADKDGDYYAQERSEMLSFIPEGASSLLDVGCSSGAFGKLIKDRRPGCEVWGIEPDPEAAKVAAQRLDKVINGVFQNDNPDICEQKFDAIIFNDVLEHLVDPITALRHAVTLLTEKGRVIASIPNILFYNQILQIVIREDWKYQESGIMDYTHLRFFTKKSILRMFDEAGLQVTKIQGINAETGLRWSLFNLLTLGRRRDWKYTQFATCAVINPNRENGK